LGRPCLLLIGALTEMLVDRIIIEGHPSKIERRHAALPHPRDPLSRSSARG
jgi:hypothetical protein